MLHNLIPIFVIGIAILAGVAIVFMALYFQHQRQQQWHETARLALEKGQPIPMADENRAPRPPEQQMRNEVRTGGVRNDVRAGLILIAVGAGLGLSFSNFGLNGLPMMGAYIPGFIGVALLLNGLITLLTTRRSDGAPGKDTRGT